MKKIAAGFLLFGLPTFVFAATQEKGVPDPAAARLYKVKCAGCHGPEGGGGIGVSLKRKLQHPTPHELHEVIKNGIPGTNMPASGLPDASVDKLVAYVQYLHKKK